MKYVALFLISLGLLACSCNDSRDEFEKTECTEVSSAPLPQISSLPLPVIIPLSEIESVINAEVPRVILREKRIEEDQILIENLVLEKSGAATLKGEGRWLFWEAPLKCSFTVSGSKGIAKAVLNKKEIRFSLLFHMKSNFNIQSNYNLVTESEIVSHRWVEEPYLELGPLKINLTGTLDEVLAKKQKALTQKLDSVIAAKVSLKKPVLKVWNKLHQPIVINKKLKKLLLQVDVQSLENSQIAIVQNELKIDLNVRAGLVAFTADSFPKVELPPLIHLTKERKQDSAFQLFLHTEIPYSHLNDVLRKSFADTTLSYRGFNFQIKDIKAFCTGEKLGLELEVGGSVSARAVLTGKPAFDDSTGVLTVGDFEYEMMESDLLSGAAEMWFREEIKTEISKALSINTPRILGLLPALIEDAVNKDGEKQNLVLDNMTVKPAYLGIHEEAILIQLKADGLAGIKLLEL